MLEVGDMGDSIKKMESVATFGDFTVKSIIKPKVCIND